MADGRWQMADGRWQMAVASGEWRDGRIALVYKRSRCARRFAAGGVERTRGPASWKLRAFRKRSAQVMHTSAMRLLPISLEDIAATRADAFAAGYNMSLGIVNVECKFSP